jgi:hypothetical protein
MPLSRRPLRDRWTHERLVSELAILTGASIEASTATTYASALRSYTDFCLLHDLPRDPTPHTLALYVAYTSHYINPRSVDSYLSGICNTLEPFYPYVRQSRKHPLVVKALRGAKKISAVGIHRKRALTRTEIGVVCSSYNSSSDYDDYLFVTLLLTGFHGLLRLGELVWPDKRDLQDYRKVVLRTSVEFSPSSYSFFLPAHKGDRFFEGNRVLILQTLTADDPFSPFKNYLAHRDAAWPYNPELWLRHDGSIPTRCWFIARLRRHFTSDVAGHSLRSGGATALAQAGVPMHVIQAIGRWSSDAFQSYIRTHPLLLAASVSHP